MSRLSLFRLSTILPFYYILAIVFIEQTRPLMCPCEKKNLSRRQKQTNHQLLRTQCSTCIAPIRRPLTENNQMKINVHVVTWYTPWNETLRHKEKRARTIV